MDRIVTVNEFEQEALPHLDDLFRMALRMVLNRSEAEDLVQEVYLQAWKSFERYEPGTNCRAWLFKILFNKVDHHRRKKNSQKKYICEHTELNEELARYEAPLDERLSDEDILRALDEMPANYREVVLLADVEDFSYREIAEVLNIRLGTVMSRLSRGRQHLRGILRGVAREYGITTTIEPVAVAG